MELPNNMATHIKYDMHIHVCGMYMLVYCSFYTDLYGASNVSQYQTRQPLTGEFVVANSRAHKTTLLFENYIDLVYNAQIIAWYFQK